MADAFLEFMVKKLQPRGWEQTATAHSNIFSSIRFKPQNTMNPFTVVYFKAGLYIDTDSLRYLFQNITDHMLIVVDSNAIGEGAGNTQWFRALHALYYGRVYAWDGVGVIPVHYDRKNGKYSQGGYVTIGSLRFERVDCLYNGFKGLYNVVLLNDRKFWTTDDTPPAPDKTQSNYEQFWQDAYTASAEGQQAGQNKAKSDARDYREARKQEKYAREQAEREEKKRRDDEARKQREREDVFKDFHEAFERNKKRYGAERGGAYDPNEPKRGAQYARGGFVGDKWFMLMVESGTVDGCKAVYRRLGKEYHPDINKSPDATAIMQQINAAYKRAIQILE